MTDSPDLTPASGTPTPSGPDTARQLVLVKNGQRYIFRFGPGDESQILQTVVEMVRDPRTDLDWFDAAVLSHQIGQHLGKELEQLRKT